MDFIHIKETVISHFKYFQIHEASQIQYSEGFVITTIALHNNRFHTRIQFIQLIHRMHISVRIANESMMIG